MADGFEVRLDPPIDVSDLRRRLGDSALVEEVRRMLGEVDQLTAPLDDAEQYPVVLVSAPVLGTELRYALALSFPSGSLSAGAEVRRAGNAVRAAAGELAHLV